jgi:hypothetical protein
MTDLLPLTTAAWQRLRIAWHKYQIERHTAHIWKHTRRVISIEAEASMMDVKKFRAALEAHGLEIRRRGKRNDRY